MDIVNEIQDTAEMAVDVATMPAFIGGIGGIAAGAVIGGILNSKLVFSGTIANVAAAGGEFLLGAAMYGMGLSGKVSNSILRSATQVSGVVIAGMGLGRLLTMVGAPSFGLGAEHEDYDDGRVIGQGYSGQVIGQEAETYEADEGSVIGQDYEGMVVGQAEAYALEDGPSVESTPSWTSGASAVHSIWDDYGQAGFIEESKGHGVTQWYGSAENFLPSANKTYLGNMVSGAEGIGSVIGQ